jgi:DNA-binding MarR family transcriptional regulator
MENVTCYCTSLRKAARRISAVYDDALSSLGVNVAQFALLRNIERNGYVSLTELGNLLELDRSTVGRNVKVLERMGWVTMAPATDRRETVVTIDQAGQKILDEGALLWEQAQVSVEAKLGVESATGLLRQLSSI